MMFWHGHGVSAWGWFVMTVGMVLFWALIIAVAVLLFRALSRPQDGVRTPAGPPTAQQLLAERFARGEIDDEEYRRRLAVLRGEGGPQPPPPGWGWKKQQ